MNTIRLRDRGITIGELTPGARNKITDVPGVTVGHVTLDDEYHKTGITVVIPAPGNLFADKLTAASYIVNGYGKTCGTVQIDELGTLETPIALTGTLNVGRVADALVTYTLDQCARDGLICTSVNPVVGETNDGELNRSSDRPMGYAELMTAIGSASSDFDEGDVGAGKGTHCLGCKGGIGSASRTFTVGDKTYTLGALVQTNFGRGEDLTIDGFKAGQLIRRLTEEIRKPEDKGSCMIIIATDLPLSELQLRRVLRHAVVGLARTGSFVGHGSGDVVLGFTTANRHSHDDGGLRQMQAVNDDFIDLAFRACAESVEEAVLNSLCCADRVTGNNGREIVSLPGLNEYLPAILDAMRADTDTASVK